MPGLNQRGPMNEGPMTGRKQGDCARPGFSRRNAGGCGQGMGRRGGQGYGRMANFDQVVDPPPVAAGPSREALQNHADRLESELADLKKQLNDMAMSE